MVDPIIGSWEGNIVSGSNLDSTTYGQGTSFPSTWSTSRLFWRTDEKKLYQNVGSEGTPDWALVGTPALGKKKFTTAGDILTPDTQSGLMEVMIDASSVTAGNITMTVDGTDTVYADGTASTTFWAEPTSSISIEAMSEGYNPPAYQTSHTDERSFNDVAGISVSSDGLKMFIKSASTTLQEWTFTTANDTSTKSATVPTFSLESGASRDCQISADGTKFYYIQGSGTTWYIKERHMSTAYDVSTMSAVQNSHTLDSGYPYGLDITDDGIHVTLTHSRDHSSYTARIYYGTMSTPWDISTLTMTTYMGVVQQKGYKLRGVSMANDGSVFWYSDQGNLRVYRVELSTPYDLTSATYSGLWDTNYTTAGNEFLTTMITTSSNGNVTWMGGTQKDKLITMNSSVAFAGTGYAKVL